MNEAKKPIVYSPTPTQLGDILHHLSCFVLAAKGSLNREEFESLASCFLKAKAGANR
jgi:hypothetical protein